jgi:hypothetical protein
MRIALSAKRLSVFICVQQGNPYTIELIMTRIFADPRRQNNQGQFLYSQFLSYQSAFICVQNKKL